MSETPRTDSDSSQCCGDGMEGVECCSASTARQLERELTDVTKERDELKALCEGLEQDFDAIGQINTELKAELAKVCRHGERKLCPILHFPKLDDQVRLAGANCPNRRTSGLGMEQVLKAIDDEPEYPGEPADDIKEAFTMMLKNSDDVYLMVELFRVTVQLTKRGISERVKGLVEWK